MTLSQMDRSVSLTTPLADDSLVLTRMTGCEELGRLPKYELELLSEDTEVAFDEIVGGAVAVTVEGEGGACRVFHGIVNRFEHLPAHGDLARYKATVVPPVWYLTQATNSRIFQELSAKDIVLEVLRGHEFTDIEDCTTESYIERDYCVQWQETDFDFISRLMEEEGIYFYFTHEGHRSVLVLADSVSAHSTAGEFVYHPSKEDRRPPNSIWSWRVRRAVQSARISHRAYDFEEPKKDLAAVTEASREDEAPVLERYEPEQEYVDREVGELSARIKREAFDAQYETVTAETDARNLGVGSLFSLTKAPRSDQDREYLITGATYEITNNAFTSGDDGQVEFTMRLTGIDSRVPYRTPQTTERPIVHGTLTAVVVGKQDEEIWTDEHGRVKVQFHWDRLGKKDENSSCWIRVASQWAGKNWGSVHVPRIGMEVLVDCLNGDPDRPIIVGCVYNGDNGTPWPLPDKAAISGTLSDSTKGGGGFNSIAFDDTKDEERLGIRAERDLIVKALNDRTEEIGGHRHLTVKKNKFEEVEWNRHEKVHKSHMESIGGDRNLTVGGKEAKKVSGTQSLNVEGGCTEKYPTFEANAGQYTVKAKEIVLDASSRIILKVGGTHISMTSSAIHAQSSGILVAAQGNLLLSGGSLIQLDAPTSEFTSSTINAALATANFLAVNVSTATSTMTLSAMAVTASSYSPGVGNMM